ncbi:hypothetical protein PFX98_01180 [Paucibacter sediminis]|uniref:Uncharacterized protein n=1 Tax=Paucibacter sediminis TaxID=3019553 RepID=A0AA95SPE2_9BURK|nr:hypothetical protein [Paucibacter sp. S2-9]WIT12245.1 hypothetical protein PFX98_01180 [Paucibacter sp. S2-9]
MVSMTRAELEGALGLPDRVNAAQYGAQQQDQLIYYRNGRTLYVYTKNGIVTAIQDTEGGGPAYQPAAKRCASSREIRDIEIRMSEIANRGNDRLQAELQKQLHTGKTCQWPV